jgi:glycosyltransferase involved in cell wall biosynthesis
VVANGGSCYWGDINWIHYLHSAWRPSLKGLPLRARIKEGITGAIFRRQERRALRAARIVVANSERVRVQIMQHVDVEPSRVHTVYYGGEASWRPATARERAAARVWLCQPEGRPLIVFVGGFGHDERKGFDTLWHAWRELCLDPDWDADLIAAGDGANAATWRRRTADAGLTQRLRLIGFTDRVYDVLAAADLLVSPTRYEPYGLNVQEAICREVPVLVSACAGATELFPPELSNLVLPDPNNVHDLVARLRCWRAAASTWRAHIAPLGAALRRYAWPDMAARLVALVEATPAIVSCRSGAGRVRAPATLPVSFENCGP